ncbi:hypothetical protein [Acinetobacter baumannii]|uniref:hypothetical protein n=1 Tax=Acinetobacter baumannii TaxID=470 RepID=UPI002306754A|nr:hypothetical protein [Acinetobacter baumannii]MDB0078826.1 hypothetical protein [Acinetobacter baumannii]
MKSKTLKNKINDIVFVVCAGGVLYLIVGFLMKTNWLSCPKPLPDLYEVVRDTLTLMAYFLAPAIALVLFSDWRQEHVEKSREQQGKAIYNLVLQINSLLGELEREIEEESNFSTDVSPIVEDLSKELIKKLSNIQHELNDFDYEDSEAKEFRVAVEAIIKDFRGNYYLLSRKFTVLVKQHNPSKYNHEYLNEDNEDFIARQEGLYEEYNNEYIEGFGRIHSQLEDLKSLHNALKVKKQSPN